MGLDLSGLGTLLRRGVDDIGSVITGQPAQSHPTGGSAYFGPPQSSTPAPQQPVNKGMPASPTFNGVLPGNVPTPINFKYASTAPAPTSFMHDLTHNPLTNAVGGLAKGIASVPVSLVKTDIINPAKELLNPNDQSVVQQSNRDLGLGTSGQNIGQGFKQLGSNAAQLGLAVAAPGIESLVGKGVSGTAAFIAPKAAATTITAARLGMPTLESTALNRGIKIGTGALASGVINSGFGAAGTAGQQGATGSDILKSGVNNFGLGVGLGLGGMAVGAGGRYVIDHSKPLDQIGGISNKPTPLPADAPQELHDMYNKLSQPTGTPADPLAALKQEALQHGSADEFLQAKADQGGQLLNTLEPFGPRTPEQAKLEDLHYGINLGDTQGDIPKTTKEFTDLYNQTHAEAKPKNTAADTAASSKAVKPYQMDHRPANGPSVTDIANGHGGILAKADGKTGSAWEESRAAIQKLKNADPNTPVTVYRSSPSDKLNNGDWVTLSPSYAKLMADGKVDGSKVTATTVPAKTIEFGGQDITEFGYHTDKLTNNTAESAVPSSIKLSQDGALPRSQRSGIALSSPDTIPTPGANLSDAEITRLRQAGVDDTVNRSIAGQNMAELNDKQLREITLQGGRESSNVQTNIAQRSKLVNAAIDRGVSGGEDRLFTEAVEHPEKVQDILTQVKKPQQFYQALVEAKNFSDFAHDATVKSGIPLGYVENHLHHNIDLSSPEQQAKFDEISQVRGKNATPGYAKERVFSDLNDVERNGFNLKYSKAKDIYTDYANSVKNSVGNQTLLNYLAEHAKGHIGDVQDAGGRIPTDANGGKFTTGRSNSLQTQFLSPQLADQVHKYIEPIKLGSIAKGIDTVGQTLKQATLALGGFHDINVSKRYITQELASGLIGEPKRLLNVVLNSAKQDVAFWSSKYYDHELGKARNTGLLDRATEAGLTLNKNLDVGSLDKNINIAAKDNKVIDLHKNSDGSFGVNRTKDAVNTAKDVGKKIIMAPKHVNEFLHEFLFGRKIPLMKLQTLESEMNRYSIPLKGELTDVQKTKLTALADQTNNMYGGVTKGLILKTGMGKYIQRQLLLAPDFSSGNMNSVVNMAHGDAKSLAWRQNMGNYLTTMVGAAVATGLIAQFTGQDGKQEAIDKIKKEFTPSSGTFLQPSVDLPYKDANGNKLVAKLPSSPVEEGIKAVSDPSHYIISRVGSAPRNAYSFATNKAYNGDLVDPYSNPNPSNADKLKATAATNLPIPAAQGIRLNNGQQNVATTVLNTGGLRVTKDPTDPNVQRGNQYYKTYTNFVNSLTPNDKAALQVVQPTKKDRSGNYVMPPTVFDTPDKAETLLRFPNVLTGLTKMNQDLQSQGQTIDPFYNLSPDQQQSALVHDTINKNNTQQLTDFSQKNAWYSQFQTDRSVYFNSLPPGDPNRPKLPFSPPVQSDQVKQAYTQLNTLSDPKDRSQFYAAHPELTQYQQDEAKYTNQILTAQHFTPLKLPPTADKDTAAYMQTYFAASKDQRNVMRTGNPGGFQNMNAYLQNQSEYEVAKNGALDQLQGQTPNQKLLKGINSLATYDMVKNPDGSLALKYGSVNPGATSYGSVSATPQAGAVSTAGSGSGSGSYHFQKKIKAPHFKRIKLRNPHEHRLRTSKSLKLKTPNSTIPSQSHGSIKIKKVMV